MWNMVKHLNWRWVFAAVIGTAGLGMQESPAFALEPLMMVKDINEAEMILDPVLLNPRLTEMGGNLYFVNYGGPNQGVELWKSDGTTVGTEMVLDINPGSSSSLPSNLIAVGSTLYFAAGEEAHGRELWISEGTAATTQLIKDIVPGLDSSSPKGFTAVGSTLYFVATDEAHGQELWKSDDIEGETVLVKDINPGPGSSSCRSLTVVGSTLYFVADDGTHGSELWKTDGTEAGTVMVKDINWLFISQLTPVGSTLFFTTADNAYGRGLWKSDGTEAGTVMIKNTPPGSDDTHLNYLRAAGSTLFLWGNDKVGSGLWKSDGTEAGTVMVKHINSDPNGYPICPTAAGSTLFFVADDGSHGYELWKSDGTAAGTVLVKDINPGASSSISWIPSKLIAVVGSTLFFQASDGTHGIELWKSDGTEAGTVMVKDILPGESSSSPEYPVAVGSTLYFISSCPGPIGQLPTSLELWKSDGTEAGTVRILDVSRSTTPSNPVYLTVMGTTVFFGAASAEWDYELWKTDGTTEGTERVKDIWPGSQESSYPYSLTLMGSEFFFFANDGVHGVELWKSDGTESGTVLVKDIWEGSASALDYEVCRTVAGSTLFFNADDGIHGMELWKTDGTSTGTMMVKDIQPGSAGSSLSKFVTLGVKAFFFADDGSGKTLWGTDGTEAGTAMVKDINPGNWGSECPVVKGSELFFGTFDGSYGVLWKSDGTAAGTVDVKTYACFDGSYPARLTVVGSTLFFTAGDGTHGCEVWKTDGTEAGTVMVKDINPTPDGWPDNLTAVGSTLYFTGRSGQELWKTDGTEAGTVLVKNFDLGPSGSGAYEFTAAGTMLFFGAYSAKAGYELWRSDGTEAGTVMVKDIVPGAGPATGSSWPGNFLAVGSTLYFAADDGVHGRELWRMGITGLVAPSSPNAVNVDSQSLTWTWTDNSNPPDSEDGFKVYWGPGDTAPDTLTSQTLSDVTSYTVTGLSPNTQYAFQVAATSAAYGDSAKTQNYYVYTQAEALSDLNTPAVGQSSITVAAASMPSNLAAGRSGILLRNTTSGDYSGWQHSNAPWVSSGLTLNTPYTFSGKSRNGCGLATTPVITQIWTLAAVPTAPSLSNPSAHSMCVAIGGGDGNPANTQYATYCVTTSQYVKADGTMGAAPVWRTAAEWGTIALIGLAPLETYEFQVKARNGADVETEMGPAASAMTVANPTGVKHWPLYE